MILIPAIDIKEGRCVRLKQGKMDEATIYSDDPLVVAQRWKTEGAKKLHVVDLDGAVAGYPVHFEKIRALLQAVPLPMHVGGGIRKIEQIENYISAGVAGVVLGTSLLQDESLVHDATKRFPGKIIAGIDCKQGRVATRGWVSLSDQTPADLARKVQAMGFTSIILTDIAKDGMLEGPNFDLLRAIAPIAGIPLIASGGVTTLDDIRQLRAIPGIAGVIIGKALYSGALSYPAAVRILKESDTDYASSP